MRKSQVYRDREGFANLEFVMSLPLVLLLFAAIVAGAYVAMNRLLAAQEVRREAWTRRHGEPSLARLPLGAPSRLGRPPRIDPDRGAIVESRTRSVALPRIFADRSVEMTTSHTVFGGPWDFQTIPFENRDSLQLDARLGVYSSGAAAASPASLAAALSGL
jgi:hypothetical protein